MTRASVAHEAVQRALEELSPLLPPGTDLAGQPEAAPLADAAGGPLDSLGIVNLMVGIEAALSELNGATVSLAESLAEPVETSPYRSRETLLAYVEGRLREEGAAEGST